MGKGRKAIVADEVTVDEVGGMVAVADEQPSPVPDWFPDELPEDVDALLTMSSQLGNMSNPPRGAVLFVHSVNQLDYHSPLLKRAKANLTRSWDYMHGHRSTEAIVEGQRGRSVKSRAAKFYEALSEPALMRHCSLYELDYDRLKEEGRVIEALIAAIA